MYRLILTALIAATCVACRSQPELAGSAWLAEFIDGAGVIDRAQSTLEVLDNGRVAGRGGCNRYSAALELGNGTLRIREVVSTKMACVPALMDQETRFFDALQAVRTYRIEGTKLQLVDESGRTRLTMERLEAPRE